MIAEMSVTVVTVVTIVNAVKTTKGVSVEANLQVMPELLS